jgi:hypothetical protein
MNIPQLIEDLRVFIYGGIQTLPLTIGGLFLILGLFSANYAYLFFLVGFFILTPLIAMILNSIGEAFSDLFPLFGIRQALDIKCSEQNKLIVPFGSTSSSKTSFTVSSYWMAMVTFFAAYALTNAISIMNRETVIPDDLPTVEKEKLKRQSNFRKSTMYISIVSIVLLTVLLFSVRYFITGCEPRSLWSFLPTILVFGSFGYAWYELLSVTGQDRLSDIFGIANRLLSPDSLVNQPVACMPVA